ncbi:MAG: phenylacetate--CoA ligase family protein, partial [Actinobacteria bacterium]|nr:phenylacetate--CoA ligase family protein [Actinomycetota bacterium]
MAVTDPAGYAQRFDAAVARTVAEAAAGSAGFAARLRRADLAADEIASVAQLDRVPIMDKDELLELQHADPPFAGLLGRGASVRRVFQSPGPLYEPEPDRDDPWRWRPALAAAGFGPDDVVINAFGYHLSPAGAMFEEG